MYDEDFDLDQPDFDEMFRLVTIDKNRKKKIRVTLVDKDGDEVPVKTLSKQLVSYIADQFKLNKDFDEDEDTKPNYMINKIMPLVSQSLVAGLPELMGERHAYLTMAITTTRHSTIMMMMLAISMFKFIKDRDLKIKTEEEDVSDEEIEKMTKMSKITSTTTTGALMGMSPHEIVKHMLENGEIDEDELKELTGKDKHGFDADDEEDD